ncbi:hypothetical protein ACFE04_010608 [Oxalis oulophora]
MAAKQLSGDGGLPSNLASMSKNQLYEIMSQMKSLVEQNEQQARQILIQNPPLTKALFQAQIMLGMVQPPSQAVPSVQQQASTPPQPKPQPLAKPAAPSLPALPDQTTAAQTQAPIRRQNLPQPPMPLSSAPVTQPNIQSQPIASHQPPRQQVNPVSLPQSSQIPNMPSVTHHSSPQPQPPTLHQQPHMPTASSHLQQPSLQSSGNSHMPPQPRLAPPMNNFHHQYASPPPVGPNMSYQHPGAPPQHISQHPGAPQHLSQPQYHSGAKPPSNMGPSFPQGQPPPPPRPSQQPQQMYHGGGSHNMGTDFGNQGGGPMQIDRGSSWMSAPQHPGPPPPAPSQMGPSNPTSDPASMTPEVEKQLLQQVMSLTPEQINLLPPEQRNQVFQLQQMLRR